MLNSALMIPGWSVKIVIARDVIILFIFWANISILKREMQNQMKNIKTNKKKGTKLDAKALKYTIFVPGNKQSTDKTLNIDPDKRRLILKKSKINSDHFKSKPLEIETN